ncbi:MAG TPA: sigma-70 family RNA polymerase sigma factor [Acidobacteriota bacterium]|nr:sigma-70 family RNA polymerase sigma factor [Acidobacteriota bacterium]
MVWEKVWNEKSWALRAAAAAVAPRRDLVDDILQDAFIRVLRAGRSFADSEEAFRYLRRVVLTTAIDYYRSERRENVRRAPEPHQGRDYDFEGGDDPLAMIIREEEAGSNVWLVNQVHKLLHQLPPELREALCLFFGPRQERNLVKHCRQIGVPYSTLRSRMLKGVDMIRGMLRRESVARKPRREQPRDVSDAVS